MQARMVVMCSCDKAERNAANKNDERFYYAVQGGFCRSLGKAASLPVNICQLKHVWGDFANCCARCACLPYQQIRRMTNRSVVAV